MIKSLFVNRYYIILYKKYYEIIILTTVYTFERFTRLGNKIHEGIVYLYRHNFVENKSRTVSLSPKTVQMLFKERSRRI